MKTINLVTPEEIYKKCPLLEDIKFRLADSEKEANELNEAYKQKIIEIKKENKKNEGSIHVKKIPEQRTKYCDDYRITHILSESGKWEELPTRPRHGGAKEFEADITTLASTRAANGFKITIYTGKQIRHSQHGEHVICYLSQKAKDEAAKSNNELAGLELTNQYDSKFQELENKIKSFDSKDGAYTPAILKMEFDNQLKELKHQNEIDKLKTQHQNEITELKRNHKEQLKEFQASINDLEQELEETKELLLESDNELGSTADQLKEKYEPPFAKLAGSIAKGIIVDLAAAHPEVVAGLARIPVEQLKNLLVEGRKTLEAGETKPQEKTDATVTFDEPSKNEYEGKSEQHATLLKQLNDIQKGLTEREFSIIYGIIAFCFVTGTSQFNAEHAKLLVDFIGNVLEKEESTNKQSE